MTTEKPQVSHRGMPECPVAMAMPAIREGRQQATTGGLAWSYEEPTPNGDNIIRLGAQHPNVADMLQSSGQVDATDIPRAPGCAVIAALSQLQGGQPNDTIMLRCRFTRKCGGLITGMVSSS